MFYLQPRLQCPHAMHNPAKMFF